MYGASRGARRSSIRWTMTGGLVFVAAWHGAVAARGQGTTSPSTTVATSTAPPKAPVLTTQPPNPCCDFQLGANAAVTISYQTYFNQYTQRIQLVPACTPNPCPPGGAANPGGAGNAANGSITGGSVDITNGTVTITNGTVTITGIATSIPISTPTITGTSTIVNGVPTITVATVNAPAAANAATGTLAISGGTANITGGTVTISGGVVNTAGGTTTITGGTTTIANGTVNIATGATGTIAGVGSNAGLTTTIIGGAPVSITGSTATIAGGTTTITGGTTTTNGGTTSITGGTASLVGGAASITNGTANFTGATVTTAAAPTASGQAPVPAQDLTNDPNPSNAVAAPDPLVIQWNGLSGCLPADVIDVEIHVVYRGREGVYTASGIKRNGTSYNVSLKSFGDRVMKQIHLTDCTDLCGPIYLDCPATVVVTPYFAPPANGPANAKPEKSAPVTILNPLPITIQAAPFKGSL